MNCFRLGALHRVDRVRFGAFHHADFFGFGALHRGDGCGRLGEIPTSERCLLDGACLLVGTHRVGGGLGVGAVDRVVWEAVCYRVELGPQRLFLASSSRWGWFSLRTLYPFPSRAPLEGVIQRPFVVVLCGDTASHKACQVESTHNTGRSQENKPERNTKSTHCVHERCRGSPHTRLIKAETPESRE